MLNSDGYIKVENLESENKCIIKILDNKNNLINTYTLTKNCILKNVVNVDGKYKLLLILKPGEGRGKISIINNESTD